ncbi:hypothetical protein FSP39_011608 [Pinctada imbricata]|uniref:Transposase n=1 Tax=Pinctada imbricata TaxID=66713 RepID=A0AA89C3B8_PINIB|nr:hypothetical protein FSP39_011608 [Pinctada imbricata]
MAATKRSTRLTTRLKAKILDLRKKMSIQKVKETLEAEDNINISRQGLYAFLNANRTRSSLGRKPRGVMPNHFKLKPVHLKVMDSWINNNPELTASKIKFKLKETFDLDISISLISLRRRHLGWTARTSARACQLISHKNKKVRMQWCLDALQSRDDFKDVIFVDESSVEMTSNGRLFFYKPSSDIQKKCDRKPKPKHAYKVPLHDIF